ncbi:interferon-induced GTP-binding protein Mx2 [Purpureocillium lavendulum]|uniref:Interferon-induced GTP-binding protein Mx2 n=1 Tax=Purpureocillium lavendulum TaxID=1247861 RepID=A0AB34FVZ5_9HYPO|nr:interferon-induced GTP-binding protein Mx2 [Purpureocillium lavendulum]
MERGLSDKAILAKIDKLREFHIGPMIPLPQLVVVGDQSSGKSSVLESLTGFSFPRATGLCTRYATQITCSRDPLQSVSISIIPRPDANPKLKAKLLAFSRQLTDINNDQLAKIFQEANDAMGIRMGMSKSNSACSAFSEDILKIEICGPDQDHLTVIDVPGIFRVSTPGLTTETDIKLVENMVKRYMDNSRTIILAVMPCNVDIATQEILKLAEAADPEGTRTMGVLTKPDLVKEKATRVAVLDLVQGKRSNLKLGYYVVKNRSADDNKSTLAQRAQEEKAFFGDPAWRPIAERCGVSALKERLRHLLMKISKDAFPQVKAETEGHLRRAKTSLERMGPARADHGAQRLYLGKLATRFQSITVSALNGHYAGEDMFETNPQLKLITRVLRLHTSFSHMFAQRSHMEKFDDAFDETEERASKSDSFAGDFESNLPKYKELHDLIGTQKYECPAPLENHIMSKIRAIYQGSRGPELGTFGGTILSAVFTQQSGKWEALTERHMSRIILLVHDYIYSLLRLLCPETQVRDKLWHSFVVDKLVALYREAMDKALFLVTIERNQPVTFNHYFNDVLQKKRATRLSKSVDKMSFYCPVGTDKKKVVAVSHLQNGAENKDNEEQVCEDVLDTFVSYYKVARKRFVDVLYQQAVCYLLLQSPDGPLKVIDADKIMRLSDEQLEEIAGEDEESKKQRKKLTEMVDTLTKAIGQSTTNLRPPPHFRASHLNAHVQTARTPQTMAQGTVKQSARAKAPKAVHSKRQASKVAKPKKNKAGIDKAHKKFTSGLTAKTEALLGERAGHLELLGGKTKRTDKKATTKAGSKKFG